MSVTIKTKSGEVGDCGFLGPDISVVHVGVYEIPLDEFCDFARYITRGGFFGWGGPTPECVQKLVQEILETQL